MPADFRQLIENGEICQEDYRIIRYSEYVSGQNIGARCEAWDAEEGEWIDSNCVHYIRRGLLPTGPGPVRYLCADCFTALPPTRNRKMEPIKRKLP